MKTANELRRISDNMNKSLKNNLGVIIEDIIKKCENNANSGYNYYIYTFEDTRYMKFRDEIISELENLGYKTQNLFLFGDIHISWGKSNG